MKNTTLFENHASYQQEESNLLRPNVSFCKTEKEIHYNPQIDSRIFAKINIDDTSTDYLILNSPSYFTKIEIDGEALSNIPQRYTFDSEGEHEIVYTLKNPDSIGRTFGISDLSEIIIPKTITSIVYQGLVGSTKLERVIFTNGITHIGSNAFCFDTSKKIKCVIFEGVVPPTLDANAFDNVGAHTDEMTCPIYVPKQSVEAYKSAQGWSEYAHLVEPMPNFIDLGLTSGTLWAKLNVGGTKETDEGSVDTINNIKKNLKGLEAIPTKAQFEELMAETDREWCTINGTQGLKFISKTKPWRYVFFPACDVDESVMYGTYFTDTMNGNKRYFFDVDSSTSVEGHAAINSYPNNAPCSAKPVKIN